ncbi:SMP-30/gluconolactonase/LRE family protein [Bosea thiooxidans]|nr:SMP-30/gluconolactonase/LRE family protein [Bosea sp. (in: a-proteobacteria)]
MFARPPRIAAEVFARLPERFRNSGKRSAWAEVNKAGEDVHSFLEGPAFDREGNLYVTDIPFGRIFRIDPAGGWTLVTEYDGEPNGLAFHADGRLFIADYKNGIMQLDRDGTVTPVLLKGRGERFRGCNDLTFDAVGNLYFTDQGQSGHHDPSGRLYRLAADGRLDCLLSNVPSPNGLVLDRDGRILYLAVTRANAVWRVPLFEGGTAVSKVGTFIQLSGSLGGPDGLAMDEDDNLVVAHAGLAVWVFSRMGEPILRIDPGTGPFPTNVAFGPKGRQLYITESSSGSILRAETPAIGRSLYSHAALEARP